MRNFKNGENFANGRNHKNIFLSLIKLKAEIFGWYSGLNLQTSFQLPMLCFYLIYLHLLILYNKDVCIFEVSS